MALNEKAPLDEISGISERFGSTAASFRSCRSVLITADFTPSIGSSYWRPFASSAPRGASKAADAHMACRCGIWGCRWWDEETGIWRDGLGRALPLPSTRSLPSSRKSCSPARISTMTRRTTGAEPAGVLPALPHAPRSRRAPAAAVGDVPAPARDGRPFPGTLPHGLTATTYPYFPDWNFCL